MPIRDSSKWVWATALRGGYVANLSSEPKSGVPAVEAFFLGGRSTIRGYDPTDTNQIIPNYEQLGISPTDPLGLSAFTIKSDSWYYLLKTELRFPIYGAFGGALFYDGGAVIVNQGPINPSVPNSELDNFYRHAVGFAIRIASPVGPINLEVGFKLNRRRSSDQTNGVLEAPLAYHFSVGAF